MLEVKPSEAVAMQPERAEDITWMEASIWTPRMVRALEIGVEGGKWYSVADKVYKKENLAASYERTRKNNGKPGIDNISVSQFGKRLEDNLSRIREELRSGTYRPEQLRRIYIPKPGSSEKRPISIPTVKDRVVQGAVKHVMEPIFETIFAETSYGFRPNRSAKQALKKVETQLNKGLCWVVDVDIKSYFDTIPHDKLVGRVKEQIVDTKLLKLIQMMLEQGIMDTHKEWTPIMGTPQGGVISPLLANIYLNELDHKLIQRGVHPTRYADDIVVLCDSEEQARDTMGFISHWMETQGLQLHPEKSKIIGMETANAEFAFLGYTFKRTRTGKLIRYPRSKSMQRLREAIKRLTKRTSGVSIEESIRHINKIARGWYAYFSESVPSTFEAADKFTRRRLRAVLCKRNKTPGFGTGWAHRRWPISYFTKRGLFSMTAANELASYSAQR